MCMLAHTVQLARGAEVRVDRTPIAASQVIPGPVALSVARISYLFVCRKTGRSWGRIWLCCYSFLDRDVNNRFAEVTVVPLNCGAGIGMEVTCVF